MKTYIKHSMMLFFCIVFFSTCHHKNEIKTNGSFNPEDEIKTGKILKNNSLIEINLDKLTEEKEILYSNVFNGFKLIPLETNQECLIGKITQLEIFQDTVYVLDSNTSKALFLFDIKGNFIRKIGCVGKGPGEYSSPTWFAIDRKKKNIILLDTEQRKIITYSNTGKFIRELNHLESRSIPIQIALDDRYLYIDHLIANFSVSDCLLYSTDESDKHFTKWLPNKIYQKGFHQPINYSNNFYRSDNDIKYCKPFCDTVFSVQNNTIKPYLSITTKNKITEEEINDYNNIKDLMEFHNKYGICRRFVGITNYLENKAVTTLKFREDIETHHLFYYSNDSEIHYSSHFIDDITKRPDIVQFLGTYGNCFISSIENNYFENINTFIENVKANRIHLSNEDKQLIPKLHINNNPVLVLYECKKKYGAIR